MNPSNAIDWHSFIATDFDKKYKSTNNFIERYQIWTTLIDKYSGKDSHTLDIGCGAGIFSFYLAKKNKSVVGIDGSSEMLKICENKKEEYKVNNIEFLQSDINTLDHLYLKKADLIISSSVIEYLNDIDKILFLFESLLNPNGTLIFSIPNKSSFYRKFESISYKLISWPKYYKYVQNINTLDEIKFKMNNLDMEVIEFAFYAQTPLISKLFRYINLPKYSENLFLIVAKKSKNI